MESTYITKEVMTVRYYALSDPDKVTTFEVSIPDDLDPETFARGVYTGAADALEPIIGPMRFDGWDFGHAREQ